MSKIALIAAVAEKGAIGRDQQLLCHLPNDLKHFKTLTSGHTVVMGRKTFESLPNGALPNRKNIVLTHNTSLSWPNVTVVHTLDEIPIQDTTEDEIFILGGATLIGSDKSDAIGKGNPDFAIFPLDKDMYGNLRSTSVDIGAYQYIPQEIPEE